MYQPRRRWRKEGRRREDSINQGHVFVQSQSAAHLLGLLLMGEGGQRGSERVASQEQYTVLEHSSTLCLWLMCACECQCEWLGAFEDWPTCFVAGRRRLEEGLERRAIDDRTLEKVHSSAFSVASLFFFSRAAPRPLRPGTSLSFFFLFRVRLSVFSPLQTGPSLAWTNMSRVAVVGATGAVGKEILRCLDVRKFPVKELRLLASQRSAGQKVEFQGHDHTVRACSCSRIILPVSTTRLCCRCSPFTGLCSSLKKFNSFHSHATCHRVIFTHSGACVVLLCMLLYVGWASWRRLF